MDKDPKRFLRYLDAERKASMLYRALAETVTGDRADALIELADIEDAHAEHWVEKLTEYGVEIPPAPTRLDPQDQKLVNTARSTGLNSVLGTLEENEGADAGMYDDEPEALESMPIDEREHAEVFRSMQTGRRSRKSLRELPLPRPAVSRGTKLTVPVQFELRSLVSQTAWFPTPHSSWVSPVQA